MTAGPDAEAHPAPRLPGDPDVWIFIIAELLMFGVFFVTYAAYRAAVLGVHHLEEFEGGQVVQLVGARVQALAQGRITSAAAMAQTRAEPCVAM